MKERISSIAVAAVMASALLCVPAGTSVASAHGQHPKANSGSRARVHHDRRHPRNYTWEFFKATNASRRRHGMGPLCQDRRIKSLVQAHSAAMARSHSLFHTSDVHRYLRHVPNWHRWGENIGWTSGSLGGMERAFMRSTPHRANILSRSYRHMALGVVKVGHRFWVTVFFYG